MSCDRPVCRRARRALDRHHDEGRPPGPGTRSHIEGCEACARYERYLHRLGEDLRQAVDDRLQSVPVPDLEAVRTAAGRTAPVRTATGGDAAQRVVPFLRRAPRLWAAAAVVVLALGAAVPIYTRAQLRRSVRIGADLLVERVLGGSLLEGVEFAAARTPRDTESLLGDLGGSRRLFSTSRRGQPGVFD